MEDEEADDVEGHVDPLEEMRKILLGSHFVQFIASENHVTDREYEPNVIDCYAEGSLALRYLSMLNIPLSIVSRHFEIVAVLFGLKYDEKEEEAVRQEWWEHIHQIIFLELLVKESNDYPQGFRVEVFQVIGGKQSIHESADTFIIFFIE